MHLSPLIAVCLVLTGLALFSGPMGLQRVCCAEIQVEAENVIDVEFEDWFVDETLHFLGDRPTAHRFRDRLATFSGSTSIGGQFRCSAVSSIHDRAWAAQLCRHEGERQQLLSIARSFTRVVDEVTIPKT